MNHDLCDCVCLVCREMVPRGPGLWFSTVCPLQRQSEGLHGHRHSAAEWQREPHNVGRHVSASLASGVATRVALVEEEEEAGLHKDELFPLSASDLSAVRLRCTSMRGPACPDSSPTSAHVRLCSSHRQQRRGVIVLLSCYYPHEARRRSYIYIFFLFS